MVKILILTILCHVLDDFVLQPVCLSKLKQRDWWLENVKDIKKYANDYRAALIIHGLSWSGMILLPYLLLTPTINEAMVLGIFLGNGFLHAMIDDLKANKRKINLVEDQMAHTVQIVITILILCV